MHEGKTDGGGGNGRGESVDNIPFALVSTRLMAPEQPLQLMATWYLNSCDILGLVFCVVWCVCVVVGERVAQSSWLVDVF